MLGNVLIWLMLTLWMSGLSAYLHPDIKKAVDIKAKRDLNRSFLQRFLKQVPISALLSLVLVGMEQLGMFGTTRVDRVMDDFFGPYRPRMLICLVIIGIGVGAHRWKLKSKFGYGVGGGGIWLLCDDLHCIQDRCYILFIKSMDRIGRCSIYHRKRTE